MSRDGVYVDGRKLNQGFNRDDRSGRPGSVKAFNMRILEEFGLTGIDGWREKTGYVWNTDRGPCLIQKARGNASKSLKDALLLAHFVKERLNELGFCETDRFLTTIKGEPFYEAAGELYTVSGFTAGTEISFDNYEAVVSAAACAGRMHKLIETNAFFKDCPINLVSHKEYAAFTDQDGFEKQRKTMRGYKKKLQKQSRLSDFDVLFLKCFDDYEVRLWRCEELLSHFPGHLLKSSFAHNGLKEETLVQKDGRQYIICFDECSKDSPLFDLASIVKRYLRAAHNSKSVSLKTGMGQILAAYSAHNPLEPPDLKSLQAILLFPDKFYKTCVKYYSKKRTWTPAAFNSALEERWDLGIEVVEEYFDRI